MSFSDGLYKHFDLWNGKRLFHYITIFIIIIWYFGVSLVIPSTTTTTTSGGGLPVVGVVVEALFLPPVLSIFKRDEGKKQNPLLGIQLPSQQQEQPEESPTIASLLNFTTSNSNHSSDNGSGSSSTIASIINKNK